MTTLRSVYIWVLRCIEVYSAAHENSSPALQEALAACMDKLCDALGLFFSDTDTQMLLTSFLANLSSESATIRRAATDAAISVCTGSRDPPKYLKVSEGEEALIGAQAHYSLRLDAVELTLWPFARCICWIFASGEWRCALQFLFFVSTPFFFPYLLFHFFFLYRRRSRHGRADGIPQSHVEPRRSRQAHRDGHAGEDDDSGANTPLSLSAFLFPHQLLDVHTTDKLFRFLLECLSSSNHNVVTSSLETLQQLLGMLKRQLLKWFRQPQRCADCVRQLGAIALNPKHRVR